MPIFFGWYQKSFDSPYPMQTCQRILADHATRDYFTRPSKQSIGADFYHDEQMHTFSLYKRVMLQYQKRGFVEINNPATITVTLKGSFEPIDSGTRISYTLKWNWLLWIAISLPICIPLPMICAFLIPHPDKYIGLLVSLVISFLLAYAIPLYQIYQFTKFPQKLLNGIPRIQPEKISLKRWYRFQHHFDFYAPYDIATCKQKLAYADSTKRDYYQYTPLGMLNGVSDNQLFVGLKEASPEKCYFWMETLWAYRENNTNPKGFGILQAEGDHTRVMGFSYKPWIGLYWAGLIVGCLFFMLTPPFLFAIILVLYAFGFLLIKVALSDQALELAHHPANVLLGKNIAPKNRIRWWIRLQSKFDFHSPYPLEDAVNMLLNYSTDLSEYETEWGRGKDTIVGNFLVILREKDEKSYQFMILPKQAKENPIGKFARVVGTLQIEGYGTRVRGELQNQGKKGVFRVGIIGIVAISLLIGGGWAVIAWLGITIIIGLIYMDRISESTAMLDYPQAVLGQKAHRKQKVANKSDGTP